MTTETRYLRWLGRDLETPIDPIVRHEDTGPDLVIGYATGYGPAHLAPFVRSLRAYSKAHVALIADTNPTVAAFLRAHRIDQFAAPSEHGWSPHILIARFKRYLSVMKAYPNARRVLIVDVRDLAFQADPFSVGFGDEEAGLVLYAESPPGDFAARGANLRWVHDLIGGGLDKFLRAAPVVCGGTIMGDPAEVQRLIRQMLVLCAVQKSGLLEGIGADQAALNVIAQWGLLDVQVAPNYRRTATIGHADPLRVDADVLRNVDGSVSPIVHQYDRHPDANALIQRLWCLPDTAAPSAVRKKRKRWRRSIAKRWPELR